MSFVSHNPVNILEVFSKKLHPTIVMWNRLEGRPRTHHFDKALKAEVRDALWMLTRQWQMGEFKGDDAGSPTTAKIRTTTTRLNQYQPGNQHSRPLDSSIPLETQVEQKKIPFERNHTKISLDIRLQLGNYWNKLLKSKALNYYQEYLAHYRIEIPPKSRDTDYLYAHKDELQQWKAVAGRCMDGYELYLSIREGNEASKYIPVSDAAHTVLLDELGLLFKDGFEKNYTQPDETDDHAWLPDRLEYQFSCNSQSSAGDTELNAEEYYHGHLDWYAFNLRPKPGTDHTIPEEEIDSFIPTHVEFDGMPDKRWWKFEDYKTSFGDIKPSTTDLSKLLLIEFGLVFANDWFLVPFTLPIGSVSEIQGITVTNNFGDMYWIEAAEKTGTATPEWSMFRQKSDHGNRKLFLCPSAVKIQESEPWEEIFLLRDEMANMVWGIEKVIPLSTGKGAYGNEYALQTRKFHEDMVGEDSEDSEDSIPYAAYYDAMTDVPENWIPFVPVHASGHKRNIQLQRASMLRIIEGDEAPSEKIKPLSGILREGLDHMPDPLPYLIHEEEVPRSGIRIQQAFERTRWLNGQVYVWLGMKKKTGRGEGNSGLAFDQLAYVDQESAQ